MKRELLEFRPEKIKTPEGEQKETVLFIDKTKREIAFKGDPREAREWLRGQESKAELGAGPKTEIKEHIEDGVVMPGMVDTHEHPFLFASFEDAIDLTEAKTKSDIIEIARKTAKERKGEPVILMNWRTELVPEILKKDLDEISQNQPIVVFDPSFHGAVINQKMGELIEKSINPKEQIQGEFDYKSGRITEGYAIKTFEHISPSTEIVEGRVEKTMENYFANGITGVHDMAIGSWEQFLAYLNLNNKWRGRKYSFPVTRAFLLPHVFEKFIGNKKNLEKAGLWKDELLPTLGLKMITDGSFGSRTAKLSERYIDKKTRGIWASKLQEMNRLIKMAQKEGIENVSLHAIGDEAIKRVVELAQKWAKESEGIGEKTDFNKWRIEHFELPIPEKMLQEVKNLGLWVSMQPNFLTDYVYRDRLGKRIKWICPHRKVLNYKIPMMFGTDGMPPETLFGIWAATHAVEKNQRLNFEEALFAFSVMPGRYLGKEKGWLKPGEKADIIVADSSDFEKALGTEQPKTVEEFDELQKQVQNNLRKTLPVLRTFIEGKEVYRKK